MNSESFWLFANRLYARPGVADACLWLQQRHDIDVMLTLFCLWTGRERGPLHPAQLRRLIADGDPWRQHVIKPLRSARQWLKQYQPMAGAPTAVDRATLRRDIADSELAAERLQGELFTTLLEGWTGETLPAKPGAAAGESNVRLYLELLALDSEGDQRLRIILEAFPAPV